MFFAVSCIFLCLTMWLHQTTTIRKHKLDDNYYPLLVYLSKLKYINYPK